MQREINVKNLIIRWAVSAITLALVAKVDHGIKITTTGWHSVVTLFLVLAAVAVANAFIRPIILFFAWPVNCLTFGLFGFGLNVGLFWLAAASVPGFVILGPLNALIGFLALGLVSGLLNLFLRDDGERSSRRK